MTSFEQIGEPAARIIYSCAEEIMSQRERAEALKRAKANTRAAIRNEWQLKERAQEIRPLAIKGGSLRALAVFIVLADQYDDAVLARRATQRVEDNYR